MVKAYLRYDLASTFGVVASNSNVVYDHSGKLIITASLENITVWNVKQGTLVCTLSIFATVALSCCLVLKRKASTGISTPCWSCFQVKTLTTPASSGKAPAEVTQIAVGRSDSHQIAVGHADGTVRIASVHLDSFMSCHYQYLSLCLNLCILLTSKTRYLLIANSSVIQRCIQSNVRHGSDMSSALLLHAISSMSHSSSLEQHPSSEQHTAFSQASMHITQHGQMQFHG